MNKDAEELVRDAFEMARESGKADWRRMTVAVLKNRSLVRTSGAFREYKYGARSFSDFLRKLGGFVAVEWSAEPPIVELIEGEEAKAPLETPVPTGRIRTDLWFAIMDFSSGIVYVWDTSNAKARPSDGLEKDAVRIPTLSREEFQRWREEFVAAN